MNKHKVVVRRAGIEQTNRLGTNGKRRPMGKEIQNAKIGGAGKRTGSGR